MEREFDIFVSSLFYVRGTLFPTIFFWRFFNEVAGVFHVFLFYY